MLIIVWKSRRLTNQLLVRLIEEDGVVGLVGHISLLHANASAMKLRKVYEALYTYRHLFCVLAGSARVMGRGVAVGGGDGASPLVD
jgi:hypothetical protein